MEQRVDDDRLVLLEKDPKLQSYFFRMERALRTCEPAAIQAQVTNLMRDITANPPEVASSIQAVAEKLAKAGYRKVEYSRSCALIARDIFRQLQSTSQSASNSFRDHLSGAVTEAFKGYYLKV
jgi:hypothetical protein